MNSLDSYSRSLKQIIINYNINLVILKGMNKMVVNHLEKLFVTNDAATIIKELEVWLK